jgi:DNA-binding beta-propeller fold protein YncE
LTALAALYAITAGFAFSNSSALAATKYIQVSSFGSGGAPWGVAVDQATGEVLVADLESVQRFTPVNRSSPSAGYTLGSPLAGKFTSAQDVAVDASGGPSRGDIYVADTGAGVIYKFDASGSPVEVDPPSNKTDQFGAGAFPLALTEPAGLAVDPANGDVYVSDSAHSVVDVYEPSGVFLTQFSTPADAEPSKIAFNSSGSDLYVVARAISQIDEFDASGHPVDQTAGPNAGTDIVDNSENLRGVAVDPATNDVYVSQPLSESVGVFESSGAPLGSLGFPIEFSFGLGVDGVSGTAYVGDLFDEAVSVYQLVVLPEVITGAATGATETSVVLEGTVNPEGQPVTSCVFEYGNEEGIYPHTAPCVYEKPLTGRESVPVSAMIAGLQVNTSYHYRLVAANASAAERGSEGTFKTVAALPTVNDRPPTASYVTRTTARLLGTINPENSPTEYSFQYVRAAEYEPSAPDPYSAGAETSRASAGEGFDEVSVGPQTLVELQPETTYHYRLLATNRVAGTETGPDYTFTTAARTPPLASTGDASGVTQTGAIISGSIDPQGIETSYAFEVGTDTSYSGAEVFGDAGQGDGVEPVAVGLQDLAPYTTYHYRVTATNGEGTAYGQDMMFTTAGVSTPIVQPLGASLLASPDIVFPKGETATIPKRLTNAQKLTATMKKCKKDKSRDKQAACEKQARERYGPKPKAKKK